MTKNIFITGARGAGKSTLARWLLGKMGLPYAGFQTVVIDRTHAGPVYAMEELLTGKSVPYPDPPRRGSGESVRPLIHSGYR